MRWQFARAYLLMMQQLTLRGYLTPHEIRIVISPYLAVPAMFPGRSSLQNVASKSAALLEMFLNAHLLDDPQTLSAELAKETVKFRLRWRRMNPPWFACDDKWFKRVGECYLIVLSMIWSDDKIIPVHIREWHSSALTHLKVSHTIRRMYTTNLLLRCLNTMMGNTFTFSSPMNGLLKFANNIWIGPSW